MNKNLKSNLIDNLSKDLLKNGYCIFDIENQVSLELFYRNIQKELNQDDLSLLHENISIKDINNFRIKAFRSINKIKNWEKEYTSLGKNLLYYFLGRDLAIQNKLNLSIQMPNDSSSVLDLHTDALSGQSVFELVMWIPITRSFDSNAMYIFKPEVSKEMLSEIPKNEKIGMNLLFEKFKDKATFIEINKGKGLLFSPTLFHGNILNKTSSTRISINCRFKNIFTHEALSGERRLGSFYKILNISEVTKLGLSYRDDLIKFK